MSEVIDKIEGTLAHGSDVRGFFTNLFAVAGQICDSGKACDITLTPVKITRSVAQNRLMWALLQDVSKQVVWHGQKLTSEDWKEIISASWKGQRSVPNVEGNGFVVLGASTKRLGVNEMGELLDVITAFGHEQGVKFSAPAWMYEGVR